MRWDTETSLSAQHAGDNTVYRQAIYLKEGQGTYFTTALDGFTPAIIGDIDSNLPEPRFVPWRRYDHTGIEYGVLTTNTTSLQVGTTYTTAIRFDAGDATLDEGDVVGTLGVTLLCPWQACIVWDNAWQINPARTILPLPGDETYRLQWWSSFLPYIQSSEVAK